MNAVTAIQEVLSIKDDAIVMAINRIRQEHDEVCTDGNCDHQAVPIYHWRGCPTVVDPILRELQKAFEAR